MESKLLLYFCGGAGKYTQLLRRHIWGRASAQEARGWSVPDCGGMRTTGGDDAGQGLPAAEVIFPSPAWAGIPALRMDSFQVGPADAGNVSPLVRWWWWPSACPVSFCVAGHSNYLVLWI